MTTIQNANTAPNSPSFPETISAYNAALTAFDSDNSDENGAALLEAQDKVLKLQPSNLSEAVRKFGAFERMCLDEMPDENGEGAANASALCLWYLMADMSELSCSRVLWNDYGKKEGYEAGKDAGEALLLTFMEALADSEAAYTDGFGAAFDGFRKRIETKQNPLHVQLATVYEMQKQLAHDAGLAGNESVAELAAQSADLMGKALDGLLQAA